MRHGPGDPGRLELRVERLDCEGDAAKIARGLRDLPGVANLDVMPKSAKVVVDFDPRAISPEAIRQKLSVLGFPPTTAREAPRRPVPWRNPRVVASVSSGVLLAAGWVGRRLGLPEPWPTAVFVAATAVGGYFFAREALEELVHERRVGIEMLMSVAAIVANLMGENLEGAMLAFLYSISEAAEGYTQEKTRGAIRALMDLTPKKAIVFRDGAQAEISVEELRVGDVFLVKPGQTVATDGEILRGASAVNQAPVTGESIPIEKAPGSTVFAGTINGEGSLEVRASKTSADNTIARIIQMVEEAQEKKGRSERFIERFGHRYSPLVLLAGVLLATLVPLVTGADWRVWLTRATVFVVAASPCALVISIPITLVAALGTGARNGVLVKGGIHMEELSKVTVVALDKTGTLTTGMPEVMDVLLAPSVELSEGDLVARAAAVERQSQHPLAAAIVSHADGRGLPRREARDFRSFTGAGAIGVVDGAPVYVGSPKFFASAGVSLEAFGSEIERLQGEGKTVVVVGDEHAAWGIMAVRDSIRSNARAAVAALHAVGAKVVMLTGDNLRTAEAIAREVGIDGVFADLKPEEKAARVRELSEKSGRVAMVGDGVNDAPALAAATVGVAMGTAGTDVALETADVALMADDLEKLVYAIRLARRNRSVVRQNLVLSTVVIGVLVAGAVLGKFTLPMAVIGHELSEFVVIASGLRMLRS